MFNFAFHTTVLSWLCFGKLSVCVCVCGVHSGAGVLKEEDSGMTLLVIG